MELVPTRVDWDKSLEKTGKIKCAEIYRNIIQKSWEFSCLYCDFAFDAAIDFAMHLENHFNLENNILDEDNKDSDIEDVHETSTNLQDDVKEEPEELSDTFSEEIEIKAISKSKEKTNPEGSIKYDESEEADMPKQRYPVAYEAVFPNYTCDICNKIFPSKPKIGHHLKYDHDKKSTKCRYCDKKFRSKYHLGKHQKRHENEEAKGSFYQCKICTRRFREERGLVYHLRKHSGEEKAYICEICEKTFTRSSTLRVHVEKEHQKSKKFICTQCGVFKASSSELATHMRKHWINKRMIKQAYLCSRELTQFLFSAFKCDTCEAAFVYPWLLREHKRKHTGEKYERYNI